jgi:hypothetical protein
MVLLLPALLWPAQRRQRDPFQTTSEVGPEFGVRRIGCRRAGPDHDHRVHWQLVEPFADQVPEAAAYAVAHHGAADPPRDHEADPGRGRGASICRIGRIGRIGRHECVQHQGVAGGSTTCAHAASERLTRGEPGSQGQHDGRRRDAQRDRVRRRACCGPCGGGPRGSRGRRGYASADGTRAPCGGGGCSAGRCACSRVFSDGVRALGPGHGLSVTSGGRGWCSRAQDEVSSTRRQGR